MIQFGVLG
ncbi:hypothetical protein VCEC0051_000002A, partial [Vibrio cholerae O1 str. EC-0051]